MRIASVLPLVPRLISAVHLQNRIEGFQKSHPTAEKSLVQHAMVKANLAEMTLACHCSYHNPVILLSVPGLVPWACHCVPKCGSLGLSQIHLGVADLRRGRLGDHIYH